MKKEQEGKEQEREEMGKRKRKGRGMKRGVASQGLYQCHWR